MRPILTQARATLPAPPLAAPPASAARAFSAFSVWPSNGRAAPSSSAKTRTVRSQKADRSHRDVAACSSHPVVRLEWRTARR